MILTSAPLSTRYLTISNEFCFIAIMRGNSLYEKELYKIITNNVIKQRLISKYLEFFQIMMDMKLKRIVFKEIE